MKILGLKKIYTKVLLISLGMSGLFSANVYAAANNFPFVDVDNNGIYTPSKDVSIGQADFFKTVVGQTMLFDATKYGPNASIVIPESYMIKHKGDKALKIVAPKNITLGGAVDLKGTNQSLELVAGANLLMSKSKVQTTGGITLTAQGSQSILTAMQAKMMAGGDIKIKSSFDSDINHIILKSKSGNISVDSFNSLNAEFAKVSTKGNVNLSLLNTSAQSNSALNLSRIRSKSYNLNIVANNTNVNLDQSNLVGQSGGFVKFSGANIKNYSMALARVNAAVIDFNVQLNGSEARTIVISDADFNAFVANKTLPSSFNLSFSLVPSNFDLMVNAERMKVMSIGMTQISLNTTSKATLNLRNSTLMIMNNPSAVADLSVTVPGDVMIKGAYIVDPLAPTFTAKNILN